MRSAREGKAGRSNPERLTVAAQERGEISKLGSNQHAEGVPLGNTLPTAADLGLSRKDIHEARQIRDAERAEPGIAQRAINARLAVRQEPTKAYLREIVTEAVGGEG